VFDTETGRTLLWLSVDLECTCTKLV